jgi:hypothetical protein
MRKLLATAALSLALAASPVFVSSGYAIEKGVTPYGDFCPRCTNYGMCRSELSRHDAVLAIESYFSNRGFAIGNVEGRGRFIKVEIFKGERLVDRIIFDRRTGRLRSIY